MNLQPFFLRAYIPNTGRTRLVLNMREVVSVVGITNEALVITRPLSGHITWTTPKSQQHQLVICLQGCLHIKTVNNNGSRLFRPETVRAESQMGTQFFRGWIIQPGQQVQLSGIGVGTSIACVFSNEILYRANEVRHIYRFKQLENKLHDPIQWIFVETWQKNAAPLPSQFHKQTSKSIFVLSGSFQLETQHTHSSNYKSQLCRDHDPIELATHVIRPNTAYALTNASRAASRLIELSTARDLSIEDTYLFTFTHSDAF